MTESKIVDEYFSWANLYVAGCYIVNSDIENPKIYSTATFSFIDTGFKKLGITNEHVLRKFEQLDQKEKSVDFYVGSFCFNPLELLIDRSSKLDIATFDFDDIELSEIGKNRCFCSVEKWPLPRVDEMDTVLFSGFPGQYVKKGIPELSFYSISIMEMVHSVDKDQFTLFRDFKSKNYEKINSAIDVSNFKDQGGFSGSLVLKVTKKGLLNTVVPCGLVYQGLNSFGQITYVRHIDFISKDGLLS